MQPFRSLPCELPQGLVENDRLAMPRLSVIESSLGDGLSAHLLQAHRLGAKLHLVDVSHLGPAPFVLDHKNLFVGAILHRIGFSRKPQRERSDRHAELRAPAWPRFAGTRVRARVKHFALCGVQVFRPLLLDVDQSALSLTEEEVLQGRQWEQVLVRVHNIYTRDWTFTPAASPSEGTSTA